VCFRAAGTRYRPYRPRRRPIRLGRYDRPSPHGPRYGHQSDAVLLLRRDTGTPALGKTDFDHMVRLGWVRSPQSSEGARWRRAGALRSRRCARSLLQRQRSPAAGAALRNPARGRPDYEGHYQDRRRNQPRLRPGPWSSSSSGGAARPGSRLIPRGRRRPRGGAAHGHTPALRDRPVHNGPSQCWSANVRPHRLHTGLRVSLSAALLRSPCTAARASCWRKSLLSLDGQALRGAGCAGRPIPVWFGQEPTQLRMIHERIMPAFA
jgi:hypothetical protein